ncbi:hypothetical protein [Enterobacter asburiae]|uniref:hypothetical protein n=1 Tax=Enterobacter asburiae TaxID=61645 RepID=UPI0018694752|nr:hypothetical protein [Enterobacter asburiae]
MLGLEDYFFCFAAGYLGAPQGAAVCWVAFDWVMVVGAVYFLAFHQARRSSRRGINIAFMRGIVCGKVACRFRLFWRLLGFVRFRFLGLLHNDVGVALLFCVAYVFFVVVLIRVC